MKGYATFSELNELFAQKLSDHSIYSDDEFSYLKVFQHAIGYARNGIDSKLIKHYLHLPLWQLKAIYRLKAVKNKKTYTPKLNPILVLEGGRHVLDQDGEPISSYFHNILDVRPDCTGHKII